MKSHYNFKLTEKKDRALYRVKAAFLPLLLAIAVIALPLKKADAQAPALSYSSPQTYSLNAAITPLVPTSSGVAAPAYSTTAVTVNTGLSSPFGVATDAAGNLYVSDLATQIVKEFPAGGGPPVIIGSGEFSHPEGITVDAAGNVYAAGDYNGHVTEILKSDGSAVNSGTGFNEFSDVAVDAAGNIYVADFGNTNPVKKILKSDGSTVGIGTGFSNYVIAVATDAAGNVYVADTHTGISKILASNGSTISLGSGFSNPQGVAVDAVGNVFISDQGSGSIKEIPVGSSTPITLVSGLTNPGQIAVDGAGNIYFVDTTNGTVQEITPVGGYYISALPQGLTFSNSTGVISGTVTANVPPTNYIVTAYNTSGSASAVVNITVGTPPAPTLSYQSPQTYTTGAAITPLVPSSTGVSPPAYSGTEITIGTGYNDDQNVATDAAGNVYVTDQFNNAVKKIPAGGGSQITVASNLTGGVDGVAVDAAGNLYVSENTANTVLKIAPGGSPVSIGSGFKGPGALAVDAVGNVYVADILNNAIKKILASDGSTVTLASGLGNAYGVAVDAAGNVYVAATYNNAVLKLPVGGGSPVSLGSGFNTPESVAVDAIGNVYVSDFGSKTIKMIGTGGATTTLPATFSYPQGLAVDGAGNIYLADAGADVVYKLKPSGGYYLNSALPAGLIFNGGTGAISGTPSVVSAAKDYTVTGYNVTGSANSTVNLKVVAPVTITSITRQYSALTNTYYAAYNVVFSGAVTGLKPSNFSVTTSGLTGANVNSVTGSGNTFNVTAFTGTGDGTVTLNMINDLGVEPGINTALPFAGDTYTIDKTLPTIHIGNASVSSTSVGPVTYTINYDDINFDHATLSPADVTLNKTGTASGTVLVSGSGKVYTVTISSITGNGTLGISLAAGTAADLAGNLAAASGPSQTFSVTSAALSGNATLNGLSLSTGSALKLTTGPGYVNYTASVDPTTTSLTVTPTAADAISGATITVNNVAVPSGSPSASIALNTAPATTTITTVVTAADGVTKKTYLITINPIGSGNATLSGLSLSTGSSLKLTTGPGYVNYTASVDPATTSLTVTPAATDAAKGATITVNGITVASGSPSGSIALNAAPATTTITTVVTAPDGVTKNTYLITVNPIGSGNATLDALSLSTGSNLKLTTGPGYVNYTASVDPATTSITVTPTATDAAKGATITVNGTTVASGNPSGSIALNTAPATTTITTVVTAPDGITKNTYLVTINPIGSGNAQLSALVLSKGSALKLIAGPGYVNYSTSVAVGTTSLTVTPTAAGAAKGATITVNGTAVTSGNPSGPIAINAAPATTTITTVVTAADGVTQNTYLVTVDYAAPSSGALKLAGVIPQDQSLQLNDGIVVHKGLSLNGDGINDFLLIEGISAYPHNKLSIMTRGGTLVYQAEGYDNSNKVFDGHSNKTGALQLPGTYFYSLEYTASTGVVKRKTGFLVLKY